ncbi:MAG: ECF transporter S component [Clostridiales bacterium]|jgi:uncharacterized membrane protein|nr:ECF transporter S component [Clostridiales bacterium]
MTTKELVLAALFIAIVFLATAFLRIPSPFLTGAGQIHTGTAVVFIISVVYGPKMGAISSLGMVLFNVIFPLAMWAPINIVVRPIMAFIFGSVAHFRGAGGKKIWLNAVAAVAGGIWLIPAMYVGELLIFRLHFAAPLVGVPGNFMQIVLALVLGLPLIAIVRRGDRPGRP